VAKPRVLGLEEDSEALMSGGVNELRIGYVHTLELKLVFSNGLDG
jgi:hypothetical protein